MRAMILAAGRGKRLQPLTDTLPKPLVEVQGEPLIVHHIKALRAVGINDIVINVSYRAADIMAALGDGHALGVNLIYSEEPSGLETGGGIFQALPLLGDAPFICVNSDIWTNYSFKVLLERQMGQALAHLVLVPLSFDRTEGDFSLNGGLVTHEPPRGYIYSGIAKYDPQFFEHCRPGVFSVTPLLIEYANHQKLSGEIFEGVWDDIGTLERLEFLQTRLAQSCAR